MTSIRINRVIPRYLKNHLIPYNLRGFSTGYTWRNVKNNSTICSKLINVYRYSIHRRNIYASSILNDKVTIKVPKFDDSISNGDIFFELQVGDSVNVDDRIAMIETDKITVPVQSSVDGRIAELLVQDGATVESDNPIAIVETDDSVEISKIDDDNFANDKDADVRYKAKSDQPQVNEEVPSNKSHKISEIISTPKTELPHTRQTIIPPSSNGFSPSSYKSTEIPVIGNVQERKDTPIKMSRMRMKIAERLKESQNTLATLTTFNEIDMSNVIAMRRKYNEQFKLKHGIKLGFMSVFIQASTNALMEYPAINAFIKNDQIIYHNYVDMGIAVSTPKGLVVPVIRNTQAMSMFEIEQLLFELSEKAKNNNITMEDMDGGTFTISNGGIFGGLLGTPIINEQQSAILGIYGIKDRPVAIDGKVEIRPMTYAALSYDHRLVDGKEALGFLGRIKELVEDPLRNTLNV